MPKTMEISGKIIILNRDSIIHDETILIMNKNDKASLLIGFFADNFSNKNVTVKFKFDDEEIIHEYGGYVTAEFSKWEQDFGDRGMSGFDNNLRIGNTDILWMIHQNIGRILHMIVSS